MGIIKSIKGLFSNIEKFHNRTSREDLGNGLYITYEEANNGMGYYDVNLCLHNENKPYFHRRITTRRGDFLNFPGYIGGKWEKKLEGDFVKGVRYPSEIEMTEDGRLEFMWQLQPDGRYFADEDGFGMKNCEEIWLHSYLDEDGIFTEPFSYIDYTE